MKHVSKILALMLGAVMLFAGTAASAEQIAPDGATLSIWMVFTGDNIDSPDEVVSMQTIEEITGVTIEWQTATSTDATEKFGLMLASGDYPDIVIGASDYYPGGIEKGIEEGVFIDMTELVAEYMPNYQELCATNDSTRKGTLTDSGTNAAVYVMNGDLEGPAREMVWAGILVRQDWLDEAGLDVPVTIDDWYEALCVFRDDFGASAPLMIGADGMFAWGQFMTAYGIMEEFYQVDGVVKYGPAEDGFKDYLETMSKWYAEGLIDPDFMTGGVYDGLATSYANFGTNKTGAMVTIWGYSGDALLNDYQVTDDPDFFLSGANNPVLNEGDTAYTGYYVNEMGSSINITTNCEDPELAAKWLDYMYSEEAMILNSYGIEGLTYNLDEDGNYIYTDLILNNPDGYAIGDAARMYTLHTSAIGRYNWQRFEQMYDPVTMACQYVWNEDSTDMVIPTAITMTSDEGTEYNSYYTSIKTLVDEYAVKVITGEQSLDNFDSFVESLYDYGLQTCIDIEQAALDRYNAR